MTKREMNLKERKEAEIVLMKERKTKEIGMKEKIEVEEMIDWERNFQGLDQGLMKEGQMEKTEEEDHLTAEIVIEREDESVINLN